MKKITTIALCIVLTTVIFAGCRSKTPAETDSPTTATNTQQTPTDATMATILPTIGATDDTNGVAGDATGGMNNDANGSTSGTRSGRRPIMKD